MLNTSGVLKIFGIDFIFINVKHLRCFLMTGMTSNIQLGMIYTP
jgi:hypothetical protein